MLKGDMMKKMVLVFLIFILVVSVAQIIHFSDVIDYGTINLETKTGFSIEHRDDIESRESETDPDKIWSSFQVTKDGETGVIEMEIPKDPEKAEKYLQSIIDQIENPPLSPEPKKVDVNMKIEMGVKQ